MKITFGILLCGIGITFCKMFFRNNNVYIDVNDPNELIEEIQNIQNDNDCLQHFAYRENCKLININIINMSCQLYSSMVGTLVSNTSYRVYSTERIQFEETSTTSLQPSVSSEDSSMPVYTTSSTKTTQTIQETYTDFQYNIGDTFYLEIGGKGIKKEANHLYFENGGEDLSINVDGHFYVGSDCLELTDLSSPLLISADVGDCGEFKLVEITAGLNEVKLLSLDSSQDSPLCLNTGLNKLRGAETKLVPCESVGFFTYEKKL